MREQTRWRSYNRIDIERQTKRVDLEIKLKKNSERSVGVLIGRGCGATLDNTANSGVSGTVIKKLFLVANSEFCKNNGRSCKNYQR